MIKNKIAELTQEEVGLIKTIEEKLKNRVCLVAVEKGQKLFSLEAKISPNHWERVDRVYPEIEGLKAFFMDEDTCRLAKTTLKNFLNGNKARELQLNKRPIRIRKIDSI